MLCVVLLVSTFIVFIPEMAIDVSAATYRTAANSPSASYKSSKYYTYFNRVPLTGDGRTDTIAIALSQIGYHEGASTSDMAGNSSSSGNYTEYNYNMGNWGSGYTYEWCATFCSWALYQAQVTNQKSMSDWCRYHSGDSSYIYREVGCPNWVSNLKSTGYWKYSQYYGGSYKPQTGDLIFFRSAAHIGLVVYSDSSYVYTIEGNTNDQAGLEPSGGGVFFKKYELGSSLLDGYGVLPYKTNSSVKKIDYSGANPTTGLYVSNAAKYVYPSDTSSTASTTMPRFTMFEVTAISNGRLKATYTTTSGTTVTGWVLNNSDRVIQITHTNVNPTGAELLDEAITAASGVRYDHYTEANLATLQTVYEEAVNAKNAGGSDASLKEMATKLNKAINNTVAANESIISKGKTYYAPDSGRTDQYVDSGTRLTDGVKNTTDGGTDKFAGFNTTTPIEIIVDLGANAQSNVYRIYAAVHDGWGISLPPRVEVSVSNERNGTYTTVGATTVRECTYSSDTWSMYTMSINKRSYRSERFVKFTITNGSNHIWLQEIEVVKADIPATGKVYVSGFNTYVVSGSVKIFTPDLGEITTTKYNHSYTTNVIASYNASSNSYIVKSVTIGDGPTTTPSVTLNAGEILIAAHEWEGGTDNPVIGSRNNVLRLREAKVGDEIVFTNVDINNKKLGVAPYFEIIHKTTEESVEKPDNAKPFWVTHIADPTIEGAGSIFTSSYTGGGWWIHVAFKPVANLDGVYEIAQISNGLADGKASALEIPSGGFVWAANKGNNYIDLGIGDIDYTSPNCDAALEMALTWKIGDQFTFHGINPIDPAVSTSTIGTKWYDDAYVCTSYIAPYGVTEPEPEIPPVVEPEIKLGDVNNDGTIDQFDYLLVKRHYFGTRLLTDDELPRADVNVDGTIDQFDYILISRHYFGSYVIG